MKRPLLAFLICAVCCLAAQIFAGIARLPGIAARIITAVTTAAVLNYRCPNISISLPTMNAVSVSGDSVSITLTPYNVSVLTIPVRPARHPS
jgi:hypothetical protein